MQGGRIRGLTTPLGEARAKDARVDKAAVFVERLFGRPMRSNPDVLVISEGNKDGLQRILSEDFPDSFVFSPLSFLQSDEANEKSMADLAGRFPGHNFASFGTRDLLSPLALRKKIRETRFEIGFRAVLEEIAGSGDPTFIQRMARPFIAGVQVDSLGMVAVNEKGLPGILVHELIHAEDYELFGGIRGHFARMVAEGRAMFGEYVFGCIYHGEHGPPPDIHGNSAFWHLGRWLDASKGMRWLRVPGAARSLRDIFEHTVKRTGMHYQATYLPYAIALNRLAREVGNAFVAFQMATEKPPGNLLDIIRLGGYYKEEISRLKKHSM